MNDGFISKSSLHWYLAELGQLSVKLHVVCSFVSTLQQ
jgi:hypothetical protein